MRAFQFFRRCSGSSDGSYGYRSTLRGKRPKNLSAGTCRTLRKKLGKILEFKPVGATLRAQIEEIHILKQLGIVDVANRVLFLGAPNVLPCFEMHGIPQCLDRPRAIDLKRVLGRNRKATILECKPIRAGETIVRRWIEVLLEERKPRQLVDERARDR